MIYAISHRTAYRYQSPVTQSQHLIHLAPRSVERQTVLHHSVIIEPAPSWRRDFTDYFGNPASLLGIVDEHRDLVIHARAEVEVRPRGDIALEHGSTWERILPSLTRGNQQIDLEVVQFAMPSTVTETTPAILDFARPSFPPGRPALAAVWDLNCRIFDEFKFDATATDVSTPLSEVLKRRRGVCQDFAHLALACLRAKRIPARYVSGYLLTRPPPGKPRMQGADASHAWIAAWTPEAGWVSFDPTNRLIPREEHIAFAFGREYGDISPVGGVLLGGGGHVVEVAVDVEPQAG